jgi:histone H3/H4
MAGTKRKFTSDDLYLPEPDDIGGAKAAVSRKRLRYFIKDQASNLRVQKVVYDAIVRDIQAQVLKLINLGAALAEHCDRVTIMPRDISFSFSA